MTSELSELTAVGLIPKEAPAQVKKGGRPIQVGLPKEISNQEKRIVLTPESVGLLTNNGIQVTVEAGAGLHAKFKDQDFADAGAKIAYSRKEVLSSDVVLKIDSPTLEEIGEMSIGACLISALQIEKQDAEFIKALNEKDTIN